MKEFIMNQNDSGQRVDKFLSKAVPKLPPSLLYKYIRLKRIKVNGKRCEISTRLCVGDRMELYINDEFFETTPAQYQFLDAPAVLSVLYEDENILLVNKQPGLVVHEDEEGKPDTLINRIQHYLYDRGEYRPDEELSFVPALCNRIDRNTCGIVVAAKNAEALRILNQKIKDRELQKLYLAVVHGTMARQAGTLTAFLTKDSARNRVWVSPQPSPGGRTIVTRYRVLEERGRYSLLEVDLVTGRTHQIRAHMAYEGHPLLGDTKYGLARENKGTGYRFQALCAYKLTFCFQTDAGSLAYLDGRTFTVEPPWFVEDFRGGEPPAGNPGGGGAPAGNPGGLWE